MPDAFLGLHQIHDGVQLSDYAAGAHLADQRDCERDDDVLVVLRAGRDRLQAVRQRQPDHHHDCDDVRPGLGQQRTGELVCHRRIRWRMPTAAIGVRIIQWMHDSRSTDSLARGAGNFGRRLRPHVHDPARPDGDDRRRINRSQFRRHFDDLTNCHDEYSALPASRHRHQGLLLPRACSVSVRNHEQFGCRSRRPRTVHAADESQRQRSRGKQVARRDHRACAGLPRSDVPLHSKVGSEALVAERGPGER